MTGAGRFVVDVDPDGLEAAAFSWGQVAQELSAQATVLAGLESGVSEQDWSGQARQAVFGEAAGLSRELSRFAPLIDRAAQELRSLAQDVRDVVDRQIPALNRAWDEETQARDTRLRAADRAAQDSPAGPGAAAGGSPGVAARAARERALQDGQAAQRTLEVRFEGLVEDLRERFAQTGRVISEATVVDVPASTIAQFRALGLSGAMPGFCSLDGTVFPPGSGAAQALSESLPLLWAHHAVGEATALAEALTDGTAQAGDVARLRSLLGDVHQAPGGPAALLRALGTDRLVDLTAALALTGPEARADAARVQATLGEFLAAATQNPDEAGQLDAAWVQDLRRTGRERHTLPHGEFTVELYGYSALGVLLGHGTPSSELLNTLGGDLLTFERTAAGPTAGSADFWLPVQRRTLTHDLAYPATGLDLDLTGTPGTAAAGWDPVTGLMTTLGRDPHLAQDFFLAQTSQYTDAQRELIGTPPGDRLDRIDYLLTDRDWGDRDDTAINAFGHALVQAGAVNPDDQKSVDIMAGVVHEITLDENVRERSFATTDLVNPRLRTELATVLGSHMTSLHESFHGLRLTGEGKNENWDPYLPGIHRTPPANLREVETARILAELSKDPEARASLPLAASAYATNAYRYEILDHLRTGNESLIGKFSFASGHILGAIAYGKDVTTIPDPQSQEERHENGLQYATGLIDIATVGATGGAGALTGPAGAVATGALGESSKIVLKNILGDLQGAAPDYDAIARYDTSHSLTTGKNYAQELFRAAALATAPDDYDLKKYLTINGAPIPMRDWEKRHHAAWSRYAKGYDDSFIESAEQDVLSEYDTGYQRAKNGL
ncbi:MAG: hypothetical protein QG608_1720 [Actinomycetota bacterium]|nr:hypothetical protein [Actinomycetota bacterium]